MSFAEPLEKLVVGHGPPGVGLAVLLVEKHQVDVARIVQLQAAELAERQHHKAARAAIAPQWAAILLFAMTLGVIYRPFDNRVGEIRHLPGDGCHRLAANDVAISDPHQLAAFEATQGGGNARSGS